MVKPFDFPELLARLRALQRRPAEARPPRLSVGDLVYEPATRVVQSGRACRSASRTSSSASSRSSMQRSPAVVTRRSIALQVWQDEADAVGSNTIDVHVARLRSKLSGGPRPDRDPPRRRLLPAGPHEVSVRRRPSESTSAPSLRVALVTTLVVIVVYAGAVAFLDLFVAHRLVAQVDRQLSQPARRRPGATARPRHRGAGLTGRGGPLRAWDLRRADLRLGGPPREPDRPGETRQRRRCLR